MISQKYKKKVILRIYINKYKQWIEMIQKYIDYVNSIFIILKIFIL